MPTPARPATLSRVFALLALLLAACGGGGDGGGRWAAFMPGPVPAEHERGERLYNSYCLSCHGRNGRGDGLGPPIVDSLFLPAITPDDRFFTAVRQGVNQRDYNYGAMPPLNRVSDPEIQAIVGYVRWLQARAWDSTGKGN